MERPTSRWWVRWAVLLLLVVPGLAVARPGGGQAYRGSDPGPAPSSASDHSFGGGDVSWHERPSSNDSPSSRFGSSFPSRPTSHDTASTRYDDDGPSRGCSGDGTIAKLLLLALVTAALASYVRHLWSGSDWSTDLRLEGHAMVHMPRPPPSRLAAPAWPPLLPMPGPDLNRIAAHDPEFSPILLHDFLYALYARVKRAQTQPGAMNLLSPYVAEDVQFFAVGDTGTVSGVIVGSMKILALREFPDRFELSVEYEAQYTENSSDDAAPHGVFTKERWTLTRSTSARTPPLETLLAFNCPQCGAAVEAMHPEACAHCGRRYADADCTWRVTRMRVVSRELRPPTLTEYAQDVGLELSTVVSPDLALSLRALSQADPEFDRATFQRRVEMIYHRLNEAWSSLEWERAHPYLSDRLWDSLRYWIEAYRRQGLRNTMTDAKVERMTIVKASVDRHHWALVVRLFASAIDTTVRAGDGTEVCGSGGPRRYSEYWTFMRSVQAKGKAGLAPMCPNCGAPLVVGMAGSCDHCGVKVTSGNFDWVLASIEQDEAYAG